ncbi:winged helix-turn-helix domain-containing protein [Archaeoglobus sp.]|uniref:winged helix-turn-helix domain-containing protein n=1 Tax=Archaeoglobus sp. TaxID=1872626 RepID=UPI0025C31A28|nr:winged helix-turn-helix domain-containing protein [Archaeoglobus sp.]
MKRSKVEIVAEILQICSGNGVNITKIVYKANLNSKVAQDYVNCLLREGFIESVLDGKRTKYRTTGKGREFIKKFREIEEDLEALKSAENPIF